MKILRTILLIVLFGFILFVKYESSPSHVETAGSSASVPVSPDHVDAAVPSKAYEVLKIVRDTGEAPAGYVGGRVFQNREGHLPAEGDYREFDVDPHNGNRNAERIIVEWDTKKAWYTGDHYQTFIPLP